MNNRALLLTVLAISALSSCGKSSRELQPAGRSEDKKEEPASNSLRVLFWNIQNGMWSDQKDNYDNFLQFVKRYSPDVCVWCEGQSIYKTGTTSSMAAKDRYFPEHWQDFAARYGHSYVAIGGYRLYADDYFPQIITSKYPIETVLKITETDPYYQSLDGNFDHRKTGEDYRPVAHGAALHRVNVKGTYINFVTLHLWPHAYSYYAKYVTKQTSDPQSVGGNAQRLAEISYICEHTINAKEYSSEKNWLMMGDFNTRSRTDNWYYELPEDSPMLSSHDYILEKTSYKDIIALKHPGKFFSTRTWVSDAGGNKPPRYDFMYASPAMYDKVESAIVLKDDSWLTMKSAGLSNYYNPSDHWPLLVDFDL